jgi:acetyl coenzyme A synthetase (ADP forming)-like protein
LVSELSYPRAYEVDVALRDGSTLHVRPVKESDHEGMRAFLDGLSVESLGLRFFGMPNLGWAADWSTDVDYADRFALVATAGPEGTIVAHAAYIRTASARAEVAFMVTDAWQHRGIATILLAHLAAAAEEHAIETFVAEVLAGNARMIGMLRESGFSVASHVGEGTITIELPTSRSAETRARFEQREQTAAIAAVSHFLRPASVAVIGASRRRGTVGGEILHNLLAGGFEGAVHPVNRNGGLVQGRQAHRSISEAPDGIELAVIAVPAEQVGEVARECAEAGVRALLVISAGFAETGGDGAQRQRELLATCRDSGMRLIGPNCLGVSNSGGDARLNATFAPHEPPPGNIGFLSQSGGLGIAIVEAADRLGLGLSSFVSVGNKADISGNDLIEYWERDEATDVVLLYLESFGNPRRFSRISQRIARRKPIVAIKSGSSPAGARATSSHTGAMVAASDVTVDALFRQAGVIRTDTMRELFDVGALLSSQPIPRGGRVAIVTNGGGPAILCADACQAAGLDVVELAADVRERLASFLAAEASVGNPIDMIATATGESYRQVLETLIAEQACDAIVVIFVPPLVTPADDVGRALQAVAADAGDVTLAAVFMTSEGPPRVDGAPLGVPCFEYPEDAARALGEAVRYGRWRERPAGEVPELAGIRPDGAAGVIAAALAEGGGWLEPERVASLFEAYGLPLIAGEVVSGADAAGAAAKEFGRPVAIKGIADGLVHKTDAGAVRLGLDGPEEAAAAAREIESSLASAGLGPARLLVQPMAAPGVELLMGVVNDESFGPVIACGAGGTSAEVLGDVAVRITPLTELDAQEMLRSLRIFALLQGYRGSPPSDVDAVADVLLRLSALVETHPEVAELDANPVVAGPEGAVILDARVRVEPAPARRPVPSLRTTASTA